MASVPELSTTRRAFLSWAGTAAALTTLSRLPVAAAPVVATSPALFFSSDEREILTRIVERMVDSDDLDAPNVVDTATLDTIDRTCAALDPGATEPLPWLLRLVEWGPPLFELRFSRFSHLSPEEQDASLRGWMTSRFALRRLGFLALRNLSFLGYYSQDETWKSIGYHGPLLDPSSSSGASGS